MRDTPVSSASVAGKSIAAAGVHTGPAVTEVSALVAWAPETHGLVDRSVAMDRGSTAGPVLATGWLLVSGIAFLFWRRRAEPLTDS